jgi:hypothetical protein
MTVVAFQPGDRVRHVHDPAVPGTVVAVAGLVHPLLAGPMVTVEWDDGYAGRYAAEHVSGIPVR